MNQCQRRLALMMLCRIKLAWISLGQYGSYAIGGVPCFRRAS